MQDIKRTSVHDFIYNTVAGTQEISIHGAHNQYVREPFYEGTPNDLFDNHIDIANELKGWIAGSIWVDNAGVLVITAEGGKTEQWLSDYGKSVANVRASAECSSGYVRASHTTKYPVATVSFQGVDMATGRLDSGEFVQGIVKAMHQNDEFATAMADFFDPESNNEIWEDTTYEEIAIDIADFCKADYREWKALKSRGREDGGWVVISEDESIVIS